jgi:predicted MFS family arabinose efflux permease
LTPASAAGAESIPAIALKDQAALVLAALIGEYSLLIMPFILVAMMDSFGISERQAGALVSLQLLTMAIASIIVSTRLRPNQSVRPLLALAVLAIAAANTLCALIPSTPVLAAARALTGLGEGAIMAAAGAAVAATAHPHRLYSLIGTAVAVVASIALVATPWLTEHAGSAGLFWLLAAVPLLLLPLVTRIPRLGQRAVSAQSAMPRGARRPRVELLLAFLLLWCGASGLWVYAERIGAHQGLSPTEIGLWLSIGQLAGIPGPLAAAWGEPKIGLRACLLAGCLGMAMAAVLFVFGGSAWLYGAGGCLASFSIMFVVPCFRTRMAQIDHSGRTVAASAAFYTVGFGVAPLVVASIIGDGRSYGPIGIFCVLCFLAGAALAGLRRG